jgi:hypothetical protein
MRRRQPPQNAVDTGGSGSEADEVALDAAAHRSSTVSSIRVRGGEVRDPDDRAVDRCRTTVNQCRDIKPLVESTLTRIGREGFARPSNTAADAPISRADRPPSRTAAHAIAADGSGSLWCTLPVLGPAFRLCVPRRIWGRRHQRTCGKAPMPPQRAFVLSCSGEGTHNCLISPQA